MHDDSRPRLPELPAPARRRAFAPVLAAVAAAAAAVAAVLLVPRGGGTSPPPAACPPQAARVAPARPALAPPGAAYRLLPVTAAQLRDAADAATAFTSAYWTYSYAQQPSAYLARLRPYTAPQLQAELARDAVTPGLLQQRGRQRSSATATATASGIRDIAGTTVTVLVTTLQVTRPPASGAAAVQQYAVTVVLSGSGWQVWDIEPAGAGQAGSTP